MKKFLTLLMSLVIAAAIAAELTTMIPAVADEYDENAPVTEEVTVDGETYYKAVGMPYYVVPKTISTIGRDYYYDRADRLNHNLKSRLVAAAQFTPPHGDSIYFDVSMAFLCDGNVTLNEDVQMAYLEEVWPDVTTPRDTLVVYDAKEGDTYIPLGINSWADLYRNTSGWPKGVDENTFVVQDGVEVLRDPERNPFLTPRYAWDYPFLELEDRLGQMTELKGDPLVQTDDLCVRQVSLKGRKLFIVAQRNEDFSYSYFFLKKYDKRKPDFSDRNNLGDLEGAVTYLRGK